MWVCFQHPSVVRDSRLVLVDGGTSQIKKAEQEDEEEKRGINLPSICKGHSHFVSLVSVGGRVCVDTAIVSIVGINLGHNDI